jgi:dUTP pyrophosphatase
LEQQTLKKERLHFWKKENPRSLGNKNNMTVEIVNTSNNPLPQYETLLSAGMDLRAFLPEPVRIEPLQRVLIPTGLFIALAEGTEAQVRPRSGLALKQGITVLNSPGTIDADYRGEIKVLLVNLSNESVVIHSGDRVAQLVVARYERIELKKVNTLSETSRGAGGFGSTGIH